MENRVDFNLRRFEQKALCSKQNAESVGPNKIFQIFAGFPLHDQVETVLVFDVPESVKAQATFLILGWLNHWEKRLHNLCPLFQKCIHGYPNNDHENSPLIKDKTHGLHIAWAFPRQAAIKNIETDRNHTFTLCAIHFNSTNINLTEWYLT